MNETPISTDMKRLETAILTTLLALTLATLLGHEMYGTPAANVLLGLGIGAILTQTVFSILRHKSNAHRRDFLITQTGMAAFASGMLILIIPSGPNLYAAVPVLAPGLALIMFGYMFHPRWNRQIPAKHHLNSQRQ